LFVLEMFSPGLVCPQCHTPLIHTLKGLQCPVCTSALPYVNQAPAPAANFTPHPTTFAYFPPPEPAILCQNCGFQTRNPYEICSNCGLIPLGLPAAEEVTTVTEFICNRCGETAKAGHICRNPTVAYTPSGGSLWKCPCGYEYNLERNCIKCGNANPASSPAVQRTDKYRSIQVSCGVKMNGKSWVCEECGFDYNSFRFTCCKMCKLPNAIGKQLRDY
jgi:hypothetical protein